MSELGWKHSIGSPAATPSRPRVAYTIGPDDHIQERFDLPASDESEARRLVKLRRRAMATKQEDINAQEERVAKALAAMSIASLGKLVSEMEATAPTQVNSAVEFDCGGVRVVRCRVGEADSDFSVVVTCRLLFLSRLCAASNHQGQHGHLRSLALASAFLAA